MLLFSNSSANYLTPVPLIQETRCRIAPEIRARLTVLTKELGARELSLEVGSPRTSAAEE